MKRSLMIALILLISVITFTESLYPQSWRKVISANYGTFSKVTFVDDNTGYAVGPTSAIYKSTDSGLNWAKQTSGLSTDISSVFFLDGQKGFAGGASRKFLITQDGGNTWKADSIMAVPTDKAKILSIYFTDTQNGWILSSATSGTIGAWIHKTTDGGASWTQQFALTGKNMYTMQFFSPTAAIACGKDADVIYYTKDGVNWNKSAKPSLGGVQYSRSDMRAVYMVSATTAYITGWGSQAAGLQPTIYLKTTDGGATWVYQEQQEANRTYDNFYGLYFKDAQNGISVGGGNGGMISKTTDGGVNWIRVMAPYGATFQSIAGRGDKLWAAGDGGLVVYSTDFGSTWKQMTPIPSTSLRIIQFTSNNTGYAAGGDALFMKTTDNGVTWKAKYHNIGHSILNIQDMQFLNDNVGYAAHSYRMVSKTTDGGETWKAVIPDTNSAILTSYGIYFLNENLGYVCGKAGTGIDVIYKTTDGGATWTQTTSVVNKDLLDIHFGDEMHGAAVGSTLKIAYTADGGKTWAEAAVNGASSTPMLRSVQYISPSTAIAVGAAIIVKSTDGGATWNVVNVSSLSEDLQSVFFKDDKNGWAIGTKTVPRKVTLYQTTDGGSTWNDITDPVINTTDTPYDVFVDKNGAFWVAGSNSTIYTNSDETGVEGELFAASSFSLSQNYPNPFNPNTEIAYTITTGSNVSLNVYDIMGRLIATLVNEYKNAGTHKVSFNAGNLASGIYFYRLNVNGKILTNKMSLIK